MRLGEIAGVDVRIHPLLPLTILVSYWLGAAQPLLTALACLLAHETAHVLAARLCGVRVERVELTPFGGVASMDALLEFRPSAEVIMALSGPAVNLFFAVALTAAASWLGWPVAEVAPWVNAHLAIGLLNLLPVLPLDGGRALRAVLSRFFGLPRATRFTAGLGIATGAALLMYVVWTFFVSRINLSLLSVALCMTLAAIRAWRDSPYVRMRDIGRRREVLLREGALPVRHLAVVGDATVEGTMRRFRPQRYHLVTVLSQAGHRIGQVDEAALTAQLLAGNGGRRLDALTSLHIDDTVS